MAKKIEMTKEEQKIYNELVKLAKRANQRLLRLERLTGATGTFASKQLYDYLSTNEIQAITKTNRIKVSKQYNLTQLLGIKKATEQFLSSGASTIREVKKIKQEFKKQADINLSYKQADALYKSNKSYTWIYEYIPKSEFWGIWVPTAKRENWDVEEFSEQIALRISKEIDEELKADLESLYFYVMEK